MSDLISREALYKEIARLEELARNRVLDTPSSSLCYARYSAQLSERISLKHMIADAPTAYDVDKVISQLANKIFSAELYGDEWDGQTVDNLLCMGDVYEILKGEVKDD